MGNRHNMPRKHKRTSRLLFLSVLILQILFAVFWSGQKAGFWVDELWSYGLANSYYHPYIYIEGPVEEGWVPGEYFGDYVTADTEHRFDYGSVFYNQEQDTHPPLFYMVLHTISSFFPETFSKWYGLFPNIIYFSITSILVYLWCSKLSGGNQNFALLAMIFWGFSIAAMSCVIYIRMYMLLTMWFVATLYLHSCMLMENRQSFRQLAALLLITFSGFFTHYYFSILGAFLSAGYICWLMLHKHWKRLWQYVVTMLLSLGLVWIVFPDTFVKIFGRDSNRGVQAYQNLKNASSLLPHLNTYLGIINTEMFAGHLVLFLLAAAAAAFFLRQLHIRRAENSIRTRRLSDVSRREQRKEKRTEHLLVSQSACAALGIAAVDICIYTILIALIAPYQADRYIFCIFPVIAIGFTILICKIFSLTKEKKKGFQAACILLLVLVAGQWIQRTPGYLYTEKKNNVALSQQYSDKDCLYITYDYNRYLPTNNVLELQNYQRVLTVKVSGEDYMPIDSALQETMTSPVVYIDGMMNVSDVIQYITNAGGYTKSTEIYPDDKTYVIYFEK